MTVKNNYYIGCLFGAFLMALSLAGSALASECVVTSNQAMGSGSLSDAIQKAVRGECQTTLSDEIRARYDAYVTTTPTVHLVRISKSATIALSQPLPELRAAGHETVIIRGESGVSIQVSGAAYTDAAPALHVAASDGNVIIDGIGFQNFATTPVLAEGRDTLLIGVSITQSGSTTSPALRIGGTHVTVAEGHFMSNLGDAILIDDAMDRSQCGMSPAGKATVIAKTEIAQNAGVGIRIHTSAVMVRDNDIHHNQGTGVTVDGTPGNAACAESATILYTAELRRNRIHNNSDGVAITPSELVPPVDLIEVSAPDAISYRIIGNIGRNPIKDYPWDDKQLDLKNAVVDIFLTDDAKSRQATIYIASTTILDVKKRLFIATIPKPLMLKGQEVKSPIFVATLSDPEHHNTSRYSDPIDVTATQDLDKDGISNHKEEALHTDPRLLDSDGDGLTDGEEYLHSGRIADLQKRQAAKDPKVSFAAFKDLSRLNPTLSDSDEDCLPDGLEMGVAVFEFPKASQSQYSALKTPAPVLSDSCLALLQAHGLYQVDLSEPHKNTLLLKNLLLAVADQPATLGNVMGLFDTDPSKMTDPTNKDTDSDHLVDGAEDWSWNGALDDKAEGAIETDPLKPDSDSDGVPDGDEDKNQNGIADKDETSPLLADSDHDGVGDAQEMKSGANPSQCDSDNDGEPDGIENNLANKNAPQGCSGMPASGTNFANPGNLSSTKADSDGDGLKDGDEDKNHNGWLDPDESDPSAPDTDGDGISDDIEMTGDLNHDGTTDFFLGDINNGAKCAPPTSISDLDCDGLSNAQDTDSDNDGCPDKNEGVDAGNNAHSIPAAYTRDNKACGSGSGGSSGGGGALVAGGSAKPSGDANSAPVGAITDSEAANAYWSTRTDGGGDCSLLPENSANPPDISLFFLAAFTCCMLVSARNFLRPKS